MPDFELSKGKRARKTDLKTGPATLRESESQVGQRNAHVVRS